MALDPTRFFYWLAGRVMAGEWTADAAKTAVLAAMTEYGLRVPKLAERVIAAFVEKPQYAELVEFLRHDAGLRRALSRPAVREIRKRDKRGRLLIKPPRKSEVPPAAVNGISIPDLRSEADVARWLETPPRRLRWLADIAGRNRKHSAGPLRTYRYRWIPRGDRFPRLLEIPKAALKKIQRKILSKILDAVPAHPAAHGFCAGRSIVTNAAMHCGKRIVLRFDLADFFPSVASARIFRIFRWIGYSADVSRILTGFCTTSLPAAEWDDRPGARLGSDFAIRQRLITRHLPQGAPTSPALANLAAHRMDRRLYGLACRSEAVYTRYADDLTFSGGDELARSRKEFGAYVALIVAEEGFELNFRKTRILRAGTRQSVTGVVVNVRPNPTRAEYDKLKAILTNCIRQGAESQNRENLADFGAHLRGKIAHVASINPARGAKLLKLFGQIESFV